MEKTMKSAIKNTARGLGLALALIATAGLARAAGFAIYENDARGFAMGNANVGSNDDASALYSNPAAITQLPGAQVKVGITLIQPSIDVSTANQYANGGVANGALKNATFSMNNYTQVIPNLYATYRLNDEMSVGLGIYTPFGLKSDFQSDPHSWGGAFNNYYTSIATTQITPTFAYRIVHDQPWAKSLSVAIGIGFLNSKIDIRKQLDFTYQGAAQAIGAQLVAGGMPPDAAESFIESPAGQSQIVGMLNDPAILGQIQAGLTAKGLPAYAPLTMNGGGWDANYNLSLQWEINDQVSVGVVYRSVTRNAYHAATANVGNICSGNAAADITLPASWNFGVNYKPIVPLNIGLNLTYTQWSSWNALDITTYGMNNGDPLGLNKPDAVPPQIKDWKNVWRYSIGGEYQLNNQIALRAGFVIDKDPVNQQWADFMVPSNDRLIYSIGLGWTINKNVSLDFAYGYLHIKGMDFAARPAEGIYTNSSVKAGHANIASVSGNFRF